MGAPVGLFGLGLIGSALAGRLLGAGYAVVGHDPNADRGRELSDAGGEAVAAADVWRAQTVLSAVFDTDQLAGVIDSAPSESGALLVSMSTCDPARMADLEVRARAKGLALVEAPISGTSQQLRQGVATLLLAGEDAALDRLEPILPALTNTAIRVGPIGNGNRTKLAINLILGLNRAALAEGLVFGQSIGLDPARLLEVARQSAAASSVMSQKGDAMVAREFTPLGRIAQSHKDFSLIRETARSHGMGSLPFAATYLSMMENCIGAGEADLDNAAILNAIERAASATGDVKGD